MEIWIKFIKKEVGWAKLYFLKSLGYLLKLLGYGFLGEVFVWWKKHPISYLEGM